MVIILVEYQKFNYKSPVQDVMSHSMRFGSVQPNTGHLPSTYGLSIIETIRTRMTLGPNDQESQLSNQGNGGSEKANISGVACE